MLDRQTPLPIRCLHSAAELKPTARAPPTLSVIPCYTVQVKTACTHLQWHPREDALLIAAGDKQGHVGLWRVDTEAAAAAEQEGGEGGDGSEDGVLLLKPHSSYVSGMQWLGDGASAALYTCAYDGVVRRLDTAAAQFVEVRAAASQRASG
jgi:hypothetical protein